MLLLAALAASIPLIQPDIRSTLAAGPPPAAAAAATDVALVPADAAGFIHIRAAELWKSDVLEGFRATFEKAGPKAIATLDKQFVPKPSTFERFTAFFLMDEKHHDVLPFAILRFSAAFDTAEVVTAYLPDARAVKVDEKTYYTSEKTGFGFYFPDRQNMVIGPAEGMAQYLGHAMPRTGPLSFGLQLAASGTSPAVGAVNISALPIPRKELESLPVDIKPLLEAEHVTVSLQVGEKVRVDLHAGFGNEAKAREAEKAIKALAEFGRKELARLKVDLEKQLYDPKAKSPRPAQELPEMVLSVFALGAINQVDELLADPGVFVKREGANLTANVSLPKELVATAGSMAALGTALLLPAVQKVRVAAARAQSMNNLKQIALAFHNYHDVYGHFPRDITDKDGKPLLSWRVAILPFIEQQNLYNQFKLDEPWDSENNKKLSQMAVKVFMSPNVDPPTPPGMTQYKGFAGPGTVFEPGKKIKFTDITDGTSNTIMVVEAGEPIPWAKPGDIPYDPKKPLPKLTLPGSQTPDLIMAALCDGSVRAINMKTITQRTLRDAITRDDGNVLGSDW
jgi:hypothetical protein